MGFSFNPETGLYILDTLNKGIGTMNFDVGKVEPQIGEWLYGEGADGKVVSVTKATGDWGAGTATGSIVLEKCEGRFNDNEDIDGSIGGSAMLKVNEPDTEAGVDLVRNGEFEGGTGGWTAMGGCSIASEAGGVIGNKLKVTDDGTTTGFAQSTAFTLTTGKIYKLKVSAGANVGDFYRVKVYSPTYGDNICDSGNVNGAGAGVWDTVTHTFECLLTAADWVVRLFAMDVNDVAYFDEVSFYELDEEVVAIGGKTLMVDSVMFIPANADGDRLILTDYNDNKFVDIKGLINEPNRIPFRKPRKLNGLKISTIDSGKAYVYLAQ